MPSILPTHPVYGSTDETGFRRGGSETTFSVELDAPIYFVPAGLAWGMQPLKLAEPHLVTGTLVELVPDTQISVELSWIVARLPVSSLDRLTDAVRSAARLALLH